MPDAIQEGIPKRTTESMDQEMEEMEQPTSPEQHYETINLISPEEDKPQEKSKKKRFFKDKKKSLEKKETKPKYKPNPYEQKFHSEFCFISLVLGVFGLVLPLFSVLAIIFGIGGLMQTHREQMKGKWMAIVGIVLGFIAIILVLVAIISGVGFLETYLVKFGTLDTLIGNLQ